MFYCRTLRICKIVALSAAMCITGARAQNGEPVTTRTLDISFSGEQCAGLPDPISVVMADEDGNKDRILIKRQGLCEWRGEVPKTFDAGLIHFSLRLPAGRTDCQTPDTDTEPGVARLTFDCCSVDAPQQVTINTETMVKDLVVAVSYIRRVQRSSDKRQTRSVPCREHAVFDRGTGTIDHVQFLSESLRLQLANRKPKPEAPGLLVRVPEIKDGKKVNGDVHLDRGAVVWALAQQRANVDGGVPTLSSNAIDIDHKRLKGAGVKTLHLTVQ